MIKICLIFGTRPEAIKMAPVLLELKKYPDTFTPIVIITSQHKEMLRQPMEFFNIEPDFDLDIMSTNQDLFDVSVNVLSKLKGVLKQSSPDIVLVQGDTSTTFLGALASYYLQIKVGHIEAGLRTQNRYNPFPEEMNRRLVGKLANFHFPPTEMARQHLLNEGISETDIVVTGNTSIDAMNWVSNNIIPKMKSDLMSKYNWLDTHRPLLLVTTHRRESFGRQMVNIMKALKRILNNNPELELIFPVHLNPNVRDVAFQYLKNIERAHLIDPVSYEEFVFLMQRSHIILTDSGGIQEEAPSLGKPVLVLRKNTERPEGVNAGTNRLVGTDDDDIVHATEELLHNPTLYREIAEKNNPFGDGKAAQKIVSWLKKRLTSHQPCI